MSIGWKFIAVKRQLRWQKLFYKIKRVNGLLSNWIEFHFFPFFFSHSLTLHFLGRTIQWFLLVAWITTWKWKKLQMTVLSPESASGADEEKEENANAEKRKRSLSNYLRFDAKVLFVGQQSNRIDADKN